jgi:hypothetical protein
MDGMTTKAFCSHCGDDSATHPRRLRSNIALPDEQETTWLVNGEQEPHCVKKQGDHWFVSGDGVNWEYTPADPWPISIGVPSAWYSEMMRVDMRNCRVYRFDEATDAPILLTPADTPRLP